MFNDTRLMFPGHLSAFFKMGKKKCVGVDIGNSSIKIVELEKKGKDIVLNNYALTEVGEKKLIKPGSLNIIDKEVGEIIKKIFNDIGINTKDINVAVPSFTSLITTIELPPVSEKEIEQILQAEAPKYIPVPLEEVVFGWEIVKENTQTADGKEDEDHQLLKASRKKPIRVVLVSIMKNISQEYEKIFENSGYGIDSLEVDTFSVARSIVGNKKTNHLIIDLGGNTTNVSIVVNGSVIINRSIDIGGIKMTELLSKALGVNNERAEKIKNSQGLGLDSIDVRNQVMAPLLKSISDDIKKAQDVFKQDYPESKLDSAILTGGFSQLKGLAEFFGSELGLNVVNGNPWERLRYPEKLKKQLTLLSPYFGTAVGLALRSLVEE